MIGVATNTFGTTAANVNRMVSAQAGKITACYREALPAMTGGVDGTGTLHLETDEDGLVVAARVVGPVTAPGRCIAAAVTGRKVANVDTGRASADVPLTFVAR